MDLEAQEASGQAHPPGEVGRDLLRGGKREEEPGVMETPSWHVSLSFAKELYCLRGPGTAARGMGGGGCLRMEFLGWEGSSDLEG